MILTNQTYVDRPLFPTPRSAAAVAAPLVLAAVLSPEAVAESPGPAPDGPHPRHGRTGNPTLGVDPVQATADTGGLPWQRDALGGDLWGLRPALAQRGIHIAAENILEWSAVLDGGIRQRDAWRDLFVFDLELDLDTVAGVDGGTVFAQFLSVTAELGGSADAGDIQVYSNIENDRSLSILSELWYEQRLWEDRVRVTIGKIDANSRFAAVDAAGDFANSSAGFSPTIFVFPSYPDPAMSVNISATVWDSDHAALELAYGFYDGALAVDGVSTGSRGPSTFFSDDRSDDHLHLFHAALTWDRLGALHGGRVTLGGWHHTGDFPTFAGGTDDGTAGLFLTAEQRIAAPHGPDDDRGLYLFAQYGWADEQVSPFAQHLAGGLVIRGLAGTRPRDAAGLYVSFADLSDDPAAGFAENETAIDLYYRVQLTPALFVQPELQYILNPSGDPAIDDALIGGVRVGATF